MLVSRVLAFWSGWVMSALIYSAKKISEQRKCGRGCTNVKIVHERPTTLGWGVYTRVPLGRPAYTRHNGVVGGGGGGGGERKRVESCRFFEYP